MKRTTGITIVLTALAGLGAMDIAAQDEAPERRRGFRGPGVEGVMQMRDRLELTEAQLADLEAMRRESVERRNADAAEMAEMRSRLAAGQIQRSDLMAFMEDRREANAGVSEAARERLEAVLSEEQLGTLDQMRSNARAFAAGRARGIRGRRDDFRRGRQDRLGRDGIRGGGGRFDGGAAGRRPGRGERRFERFEDGSGPGFQDGSPRGGGADPRARFQGGGVSGGPAPTPGVVSG